MFRFRRRIARQSRSAKAVWAAHVPKQRAAFRRAISASNRIPAMAINQMVPTAGREKYPNRRRGEQNFIPLRRCGKEMVVLSRKSGNRIRPRRFQFFARSAGRKSPRPWSYCLGPLVRPCRAVGPLSINWPPIRGAEIASPSLNTDGNPANRGHYKIDAIPNSPPISKTASSFDRMVVCLQQPKMHRQAHCAVGVVS